MLHRYTQRLAQCKAIATAECNENCTTALDRKNKIVPVMLAIGVIVLMLCPSLKAQQACTTGVECNRVLEP